MKKLYYHPETSYNPNSSESYCLRCGSKMVESNLSEQPCSVPTAAQSLYEGYRFEISVWNLRASLLCFTEDKYGNRKYFDLKADENILSAIDQLAEESVYGAGGAINFSGIYPLSEVLENFLEDGIKSGKIVINPMQ